MSDEQPKHADEAFDPRSAQTATTVGDALELARAWADGRRSWANLGHAPDETAVMDAQEVVKWTAMAVALAQVEATRRQLHRLEAAANAEGKLLAELRERVWDR